MERVGGKDYFIILCMAIENSRNKALA